MDIITLGIDLGRSEIRLSDGEQVIALPTLLGGPVSTVKRGQSRVGDDFLESQLAVRLGRRSYSVGQLALAQAVDFPVNDPDLFADELNLVLLLALLGLYVRRRGITGTPRFKISLGLPVGLSRRRAHVEAQLATWVGLHQFELAGENLSFEILQIEPMPTAVGAVYAALLEGQVAFSASHNVGVIDAGHTSTDYLVVRLPHELSAYSGHSPAAAGCRLEQILVEFLESEGLVRVHPLRLREALATRVYVDGSTRIEIPETLWADTLEPLAQHVALTVKQAWRDLAIERMVLVGGFGKFLYPYLVQFPYFRDCLLADDVRHLNVRGLFEYALASPLRPSGVALETSPTFRTPASTAPSAVQVEMPVAPPPLSAVAEVEPEPAIVPELEPVAEVEPEPAVVPEPEPEPVAEVEVEPAPARRSARNAGSSSRTAAARPAEPAAPPAPAAAPAVASGGKMDQAAIDALIAGAQAPAAPPAPPASPAAAMGKLDQGNIDSLIASLAAQG
ncbi:MAG: hypothetical protein VKP72_02895 [bacterium]|nr:hypothetical protein [bacterium]